MKTIYFTSSEVGILFEAFYSLPYTNKSIIQTFEFLNNIVDGGSIRLNSKQIQQIETVIKNIRPFAFKKWNITRQQLLSKL